MTRFLVHIGTNKTGTSSLQRAFFDNREALKPHGIIYPLTGIETAAHHRLSRAVKGADLAALGLDADWPAVLQRECAGYQLCLLSSENFHTIQEPALLAPICPPGQTRIILYVREHVAHMVSWYQQAVQSRNTAMTLPEFIEHHSYSYSDMIAKWVAVYGRDNVIIRLYDRANLRNRDIIADFCSFAKPEIEPILNRTAQSSNPSISGNLLFVKRVLNCFVTEAESLSVANEVAALTSLDPSFTGKIPVDLQQVRRINFLARDDRHRLQQEYGLKMKPRLDPVNGPAFPDPDRLASDYARLLSHSQEREFRLVPLLRRMQAMFDQV